MCLCANTASNGPIASPARMAAKMIRSVGERTGECGRTVTITCSGHILCMWTALAMNYGLRAEKGTQTFSSHSGIAVRMASIPITATDGDMFPQNSRYLPTVT